MSFNFPSAPTFGQASNGYVWDGQKWVKSPPGDATISTNPPANPLAGQLWWDSDTGVMYIYYADGTSAQWVAVDSNAGAASFVLKTGDTMTGPLTFVPAATVALVANGQMAFEAISNTQLAVRYRGSDGVVRSAVLVLA